MNKKLSFGAALAFMFIVAAATFSITMVYARGNFNAKVHALKARENMFEKFTEIDRQVGMYYYGDVDETQLMDSVAKGYVAGIGDQYAVYIPAEEYKKRILDAAGDNVGIGAVVEISQDDFYLEVMEVYPDSPASVASMEPGDLIVQIDGADVTRENNKTMLESITGPQGTKITLLTRRGSTENNVELTRRAVSIPTVHDAHVMEDSQVGYLRISDFGDRTHDAFNRELQKLTDAGATSLVVDLRDNKGTTLRSASRILDKILPEGVLITAQRKDGTVETLYLSDANEISLPVVVLTNGGTSSAAELFALSIRDFEKGRIVGTTTAGKDVMLDTVLLSDGSAIELTVAHYRTKSDTDFSTGVKPDYEVKLEGDWVKLDDANDPQRTKARDVAAALVLAATEVPAEESAPDASQQEEVSPAPSEADAAQPDADVSTATP